MTQPMQSRITILMILVLYTTGVVAQEGVAPLGYRSEGKSQEAYHPSSKGSAAKTTAITLPYFEDFTQSDFFPDTNRWADRQVYINNNMGVNPISRGVATFDALNENGLPYETQNKGLLRYADSLTSKAIDLSSYTAGDSLYFSFFYQPEGNGFDPQVQDSLMLYFRRANTSSPWMRVWRVAGSSLQSFQQVMIPITDAGFFNTDFQFRFVNKASINTTDDNWNVDYIRLGANRNINDTALEDVAFTVQPSFILNDYTYMPYHQFMADANKERAAEHTATIRNNSGNTVNINYGYNAVEDYTNAFLDNGSGSISIAPDAEAGVNFPVYTATIPAPSVNNQPVTFENKYYLQSTSQTGYVDNDTIIRRQDFYNFLAYDDGTPEKSYYLKMFTTLPAKIAIQHRLNVPDTLKGIGIYFGRQVPLAYQKYFSVAVYRDIAFNGGTDQLLYQEDFLIPNYLAANNFWYYKFEKPLVLPAGTFYIGTIQPALGSSDSLYFGLDVDRTSDNHAFFSVENTWKASQIQGAIMMRPMFGQFFPSIISAPVNQQTIAWDIVPNPATDRIRFNYDNNSVKAVYTIADMQGRVVKTGEIEGEGYVAIGEFIPGIYIAHLTIDGQKSTPKKIIKL